MSGERAVRLEWTGDGHRFEGWGTTPATPAVVIDGDGAAGPSPMLALLLAAAACSAADIVTILEKMRVRLTALAVEVRGTRRADAPRRYVTLQFAYRLAGDGLDRPKAERVVTLSLEKYCSVVHTLAPDITITHEIELA